MNIAVDKYPLTTTVKCRRSLTLWTLHSVQLPIFDPLKIVQLNKPDIKILLVKFTTESDGTFSLQKNFQITGTCLNKIKFFGPTEYLHNTFKPLINQARKKSC